MNLNSVINLSNTSTQLKAIINDAEKCLFIQSHWMYLLQEGCAIIIKKLMRECLTGKIGLFFFYYKK
jgi:hypothetical protein